MLLYFLPWYLVCFFELQLRLSPCYLLLLFLDCNIVNILRQQHLLDGKCIRISCKFVLGRSCITHTAYVYILFLDSFTIWFSYSRLRRIFNFRNAYREIFYRNMTPLRTEISWDNFYKIYSKSGPRNEIYPESCIQVLNLWLENCGEMFAKKGN